MNRFENDKEKNPTFIKKSLIALKNTFKKAFIGPEQEDIDLNNSIMNTKIRYTQSNKH